MLLWSKLEVWSNTTKCVKNIPCPMEEDKPLLLALVSGDIRDDEEFTDVTLAWEDGLPIEAHKAILVGWSPQTNTPIPWSKLEVCSPIRKLSVPFLGPGFVEESETLESKTKERCWGGLDPKILYCAKCLWKGRWGTLDTCIFCGLFWRFWLKNPPSSCCMHGDKYF